MRKAAVVIGVNKTGDLPVLKDAAAGAARVATWLHDQGYETARFVDDQTPVRVGDVFTAVEGFVRPGDYEQLIIYFSGHGYLNDGSEHWLLSNAPANPNEAISLDENVQLARDCGIPNVIFISDACRSTPQSLKANRVRGSLIFPNEGVARQNRADIDRLFACLPGDPAYEVPVETSSKQYAALFTACLRKAYEDTPATQTLKIGADEVLPNRKLKRLLPGLVDRAAQSSSISLFQKPDIIIESEPEIFIAKVERSPVQGELGKALAWFRGTRLFGAPELPVDMEFEAFAQPAGDDLREQAIDLIAGSLDGGGLPAVGARLSDAIKFAQSVPSVDHFETECGFVIHGTVVADVVGVGCDAVILAAGGVGAEALVRVEWRGGAGKSYDGSVLIRFANGAGTVLAALAGYIGTVIVDNTGGGEGRTDGVAQITYAPSSNSWRWQEYKTNAVRIEALQARVAGLARNGVFRIEKDQAADFAAKIRLYKGCDPTLGLYASYAYNDIGLRESVESVAGFVKEDLGGLMLYDVALLLGRTGAGDFGWLVPFCPMLSQGWPLLRVQRAVLPEAVREAGEYRRASLWTTFERRGMDILFDAQLNGGLS